LVVCVSRAIWKTLVLLSAFDPSHKWLEINRVSRNTRACDYSKGWLRVTVTAEEDDEQPIKTAQGDLLVDNFDDSTLVYSYNKEKIEQFPQQDLMHLWSLFNATVVGVPVEAIQHLLPERRSWKAELNESKIKFSIKAINAGEPFADQKLTASEQEIAKCVLKMQEMNLV